MAAVAFSDQVANTQIDEDAAGARCPLRSEKVRARSTTTSPEDDVGNQVLCVYGDLSRRRVVRSSHTVAMFMATAWPWHHSSGNGGAPTAVRVRQLMDTRAQVFCYEVGEDGLGSVGQWSEAHFS